LDWGKKSGRHPSTGREKKEKLQLALDYEKEGLITMNWNTQREKKDTAALSRGKEKKKKRKRREKEEIPAGKGRASGHRGKTYKDEKRVKHHLGGKERKGPCE